VVLSSAAGEGTASFAGSAISGQHFCTDPKIMSNSGNDGSTAFTNALQQCVQVVCSLFGFELGEVWLPGPRSVPDKPEFCFHHIWANDEFWLSYANKILPPVGLRNRLKNHRYSPYLCKKVLESQNPVWCYSQNYSGLEGLSNLVSILLF
jgi:hypothetical protein